MSDTTKHQLVKKLVQLIEDNSSLIVKRSAQYRTFIALLLFLFMVTFPIMLFTKVGDFKEFINLDYGHYILFVCIIMQFDFVERYFILGDIIGKFKREHEAVQSIDYEFDTKTNQFKITKLRIK